MIVPKKDAFAVCTQILGKAEICKGKYSDNANSRERMLRKDTRRNRLFGIVVFRLYFEK